MQSKMTNHHVGAEKYEGKRNSVYIVGLGRENTSYTATGVCIILTLWLFTGAVPEKYNG